MAVQFLAGGDTALVVQFGDSVDAVVNAHVMRLNAAVCARNIEGIIETVPTFRSLMVHYDPLRTSSAVLQETLAPLLDNPPALDEITSVWHLPVCYEGDLAPDLDDVAERTGLTPERVVELHAGTPHRVYMIGFLPGHPYMGDLPKELELPRRVEPRTRVPAGSVAIATTMSVVYPNESPGGWHLIGRTPVPMFRLERARPVQFAPGDEIRFTPVERALFDDIAERVEKGAFDLVPGELPA